MLPTRKPEWLRAKMRLNPETQRMVRLLRSYGLHSVCEAANCPNRTECFERRTATFMLLGENCSRNCTFCTVSKEELSAVDPEEPMRVAQAAKALGLKHVVVTSVTRDDLADGGATQFADTIRAIRSEMEDAPIIEVLIPDFQGDSDALQIVIDAQPTIINHNIETVPRLYPEVRPMAVYERSLELLRRVKAQNLYTKSGLMVGLGETPSEVLATLHDLREHGCDMVTIGQYLAPSAQHHEVVEYVTPETFDYYREQAEQMGFLMVSSGPLVRSSYMAKETFDTIL